MFACRSTRRPDFAPKGGSVTHAAASRLVLRSVIASANVSSKMMSVTFWRAGGSFASAGSLYFALAATVSSFFRASASAFAAASSAVFCAGVGIFTNGPVVLTLPSSGGSAEL